MIDAKELRLGNYIYASGLYENRLVKVEQIGSKGTLSEDKRVIMFEGLNVGEFSCDCNPIPLTPEWLERCGEKCDRPDWQYQIQVGALKWYFRWNTEWYSELGGIYLDSRFKHVHQVQNLYFLLIGHELTIKSFNQSN